MVQERVRFIKDTGLYEDGQMILERYGEKYKLTYFKKLLRKKGIEQAIEKPPVSAMEQKWDEYLELSMSRPYDGRISGGVERPELYGRAKAGAQCAPRKEYGV